MWNDKTGRGELRRTFLIDALPEPLTRSSTHLQIFDNYLPNTRLRLRSVRVPETKDWSRTLQQRFPLHPDNGAEWKVAEIHLDPSEHEHFKIFEGNEIRKNRYFHEFDGRVFSFDVYLGPLWGLNRAKVEFDALDELEQFEAPPFASIEITNAPFFYDENLVGRGFDEVRRELERLGLPAPNITADE